LFRWLRREILPHFGPGSIVVVLRWLRGIARPALILARVAIATTATPPATLTARLAFDRSLFRGTCRRSGCLWLGIARPVRHALDIAAVTVAIPVAIAVVIAVAILVPVVALVGPLAMIA
jgi:hypothetical protein